MGDWGLGVWELGGFRVKGVAVQDFGGSEVRRPESRAVQGLGFISGLKGPNKASTSHNRTRKASVSEVWRTTNPHKSLVEWKGPLRDHLAGRSKL